MTIIRHNSDPMRGRIATRNHRRPAWQDAPERTLASVTMDEARYGRHRPTPEQRARAAAEWDAMDEFGRLPDGWEYRPGEAA